VKDDETYFSSNIKWPGVAKKIVVFKNKKQQRQRPDYIIYMSEKKQDDTDY